MDKTEHIEVALNELIKRCTENGGFVWIVDKRQNNFAIRLTEAVRISAFVPKAREESNEKMD